MQNDQQYIDRILNSGSESAVFGLVKKYEGQVFNLCFRILRNREEAEEVAQDAFMKSFKELRKLDDHTKFGGWLMKIAYNKSIDQTRRKKPDLVSVEERTLGFEDHFFDMPSDELAKKDRSELLELVLAKLPETDNAIITLYYLDGLSVKEVAEITGLSESNVKIRLMRAREVLKKQINKYLKTETEDLY